LRLDFLGNSEAGRVILGFIDPKTGRKALYGSWHGALDLAQIPLCV
jgi:hypothetical protein